MKCIFFILALITGIFANIPKEPLLDQPIYLDDGFTNNGKTNYAIPQTVVNPSYPDLRASDLLTNSKSPVDESIKLTRNNNGLTSKQIPNFVNNQGEEFHPDEFLKNLENTVDKKQLTDEGIEILRAIQKRGEDAINRAIARAKSNSVPSVQNQINQMGQMEQKLDPEMNSINKQIHPEKVQNKAEQYNQVAGVPEERSRIPIFDGNSREKFINNAANDLHQAEVSRRKVWEQKNRGNIAGNQGYVPPNKKVHTPDNLRGDVDLRPLENVGAGIQENLDGNRVLNNLQSQEPYNSFQENIGVHGPWEKVGLGVQENSFGNHVLNNRQSQEPSNSFQENIGVHGLDQVGPGIRANLDGNRVLNNLQSQEPSNSFQGNIGVHGPLENIDTGIQENFDRDQQVKNLQSRLQPNNIGGNIGPHVPLENTAAAGLQENLSHVNPEKDYQPVLPQIEETGQLGGRFEGHGPLGDIGANFDLKGKISRIPQLIKDRLNYRASQIKSLVDDVGGMIGLH